MKGKISLFLILLLPLCLLAQNAEDFDASLKDKGFDFFIGGGIYMGSKITAEYYNGRSYNENNLDYLFGNEYWYDEIMLILQDNYSNVGDSIWVDSYPDKLKYRVSMSISIGLRYKFNKHWGFILNNTFSRLKATGPFDITISEFSGNQQSMYATQTISGKENRYLIEAGCSYIFNGNEILHPFLEFGLQFNYVKVKEFVAVIENGMRNEKKYNLLNIYGSDSYIPGMQQTTYDNIWGGPGFGFSASVGLKINVNKEISLDPMFYCSMSRFGLEGYKQFCFNYGVLVRVNMSDRAFMNSLK